jgi:hypothetical protein
MGKKRINFSHETLKELLPYTRRYYKLPRKKKKAMKKRITKDIEKAIIAFVNNYLEEQKNLIYGTQEPVLDLTKLKP